jgi:hypothetical protein
VSPLFGEWHQVFTCEGNVRTFQRNLSRETLEQRKSLATLKGNGDASLPTLLREYTREFAWGPSAPGSIHGVLTKAQLKPTIICKDAPTRERTMRFIPGHLAVYDWDNETWTASLVVVDGGTFTANDGGQNFGDPPTPTDTFSFRIDGDTLTITTAGRVDAWAGTFLEEAPWTRLS